MVMGTTTLPKHDNVGQNLSVSEAHSLAKIIGPKTKRQKLVKGPHGALVSRGRVHVYRSGEIEEFSNHLSTDSTRRNRRLLVAGNGNGSEFAVPHGHRTHYGCPFGANGPAIQGIFDVGTRDHVTAVSKHSGADSVGVRRDA